MEAEEDFIPAPQDDHQSSFRGGRGRGRGGPNKRMRTDDSGQEDYNNQYEYDESYNYNDHGYYPPTQYRGGGRAFGFRGGRGRGRGRSFAGRGAPEPGSDGNIAGGGDEGGNKPVSGDNSGGDTAAEVAQNHPSPMVAAAYRGGYNPRGRGRGRGRFPGRFPGFPGRTEVVSMIASKTWRRPKEGESSSASGGGAVEPDDA